MAEGHDVVVIDDLSTGKLENLQGILDVTDARRFWNASIRNYSQCLAAAKGCDAIVHLAALGSVPRSIEDPFSTHEVNVTGTMNLLDIARHERMKRFVYSSSSSVYGLQDGDGGFRRLSDVPNPISPYGASKLSAERYCAAFWHSYGLPTIALRYFNVYGPRQDPDSQYSAVIPRFFKAVHARQAMTIYGDGLQSRDFTYVKDVVAANLCALRTDVSMGRCHGRAYNVGCGMNTTVSQLADAVGQEAAPLEHTFVTNEKPRIGDVKHSCADLEASRCELGYEPKVGIAEGLKLTAPWYADKFWRKR